MGNVRLIPTGAFAVTDIDGKATIQNVPAGEYQLNVSYVGYESRSTTVKLSRDLKMAFALKPTTLKLKEVTVTARQNVAGTSTSSIIGRQAIDHLQATSLADVMQLIPGQLMGNNNLTSAQNLQLRSLVNNNTNAFGSSVVMDGVPMSNNGAVTQGGFSSTAFVGTDLRRISADDIDQVEVIRGIPSAEYGDLTSGLVVVHSKVGVTPWQVKGKMTPALMNASLGKGLNIGKMGVVNFNADYARAWGDPRNKTQTFNRYNMSLGWGYNFSKIWHADTKLRYMQNITATGSDPDMKADGTDMRNSTLTLALTHNGKLNLGKTLARTLSYTFGFSYTAMDNENTAYVTNSSGLIPIITARETGYHNVPWMTSSYLATGKTESRPGNVFLKLNDAFFWRSGKVMQSYKVGAEYKYDWNSGRGYYNANEQSPLRPNSNGRPRAFSDIPGINQLSAYAEDNLTWEINRVNRLRAQLGVRLTAMQPFADVATTALSPRFNLSYSFTKWLTVRAGFGLNSKTPSLDYIYPDKKYDDRVAANYISATDPTTSILNYHTEAYQVQYSRNLKNATTTKYEAGVDIKLPRGGNISLLGYYDRTPNGFGSATEYYTYESRFYEPSHGLNIMPGQATTINYSDPLRTDVVFMTTGKVGNTNTAINKGVELDMQLPEIKPLSTTVYLSGAYSMTKTNSTDMNSQSVPSAYLYSSYSAYGLTPFKLIYPSGEDYTKYRRLVGTMRIVTNIPLLRMVASFTAQAILHDYSHSFVTDKSPIAYITPDLARHELTPAMQSGYLLYDGTYTSAQPTAGNYISVSDLHTSGRDSKPTRNPVTWNMQGRLTKELGDFGGLSLYVNNIMFYEPYLHSNNTTSLTQRNTGTFNYGVELYINL